MIASNVDLEDLARNTSHHVFGLGLHERKVIIDDGEPVAVIMSAGEFERLSSVSTRRSFRGTSFSTPSPPHLNPPNLQSVVGGL